MAGGDGGVDPGRDARGATHSRCIMHHLECVALIQKLLGRAAIDDQSELLDELARRALIAPNRHLLGLPTATERLRASRRRVVSG